MKKVLLDRSDWPQVLTPELREQLLLGKIARVQHAMTDRRKLPRHIRGELKMVCCNDEKCQHE